MKKMLISVSVLLGIVFVIYSITWYRIYAMTKDYYVQAERSLEENRKGTALKGGTDFITGEFVGSYQQVIEGWRDGLAVPKPGFYYDALERRDEILKTLSLEEIDSIFSRYFKVDNLYLDQLLFRKAELLETEGKDQEALQVYELIQEIFPLNKGVQEKIQNKIK